MLIAGERVADQHRVAAVGIERTVCLVGDLKGAERDACVEPERLVFPKDLDRRVRLIRLPLPNNRYAARDGFQLGHMASRSSQVPLTSLRNPLQ
jgi:hypothetical protein